MLAQRLADSAPNSDKELRTQLSQHFGLVDPTTDELRSLQESEEVWQLDQVLSQIVSARAELGWSTHGHSGADVSLYARGYKAKNLKGSIDNTEVCSF